MEERNQPRRPRRDAEQPQQKSESLIYGKNPVTELLKSGSGVDTVLIAEGMAPAVAAYYTALAKEAGATVKRVHPNKLRLMTGTESHQGVAAFARIWGNLLLKTRWKLFNSTRKTGAAARLLHTFH